MTDRALRAKQAVFVAEYLKDLNATQAAIRAGYSAKTAEQQGPRLLGNAGVQAAIQAGQAARAVRTGITQDRVLCETSLLAFSDLQHYVVDDLGNVQLAAGAPEGAMRALQSIKRKVITRGSGEDAYTTYEVELRLWDKPGVLKLAGQHVGLFRDKVELTGANGGPVRANVTFGGRYRPDGTKREPAA